MWVCEMVATEAVRVRVQMLKLATAAAGEVTPGAAAKSTEIVGATASAVVAVTSIPVLGRRKSGRCAKITSEVSKASPSGARITQYTC